MLSPTQKIRVITILDNAIARGTKKKDDNYAYHCPFCNHRKKKLEIDITSGKYHCWVCDAKGTRIHTLLRKIKVNNAIVKEIKGFYDDKKYTPLTTPTDEVVLSLPNEFKSLRRRPNGFEPMYSTAFGYVKSRGITKDDIVKYNIGYCSKGSYSGRIIIPSYDSDNQLNYFIARTMFPDVSFVYKNPPVGKNIIAFENQINWQQPITICEGIYDAIAIKRNAIPLFGKFMSKKLMNAIFENGVTDITIMLDTDAQSQALYYTTYFRKQGIRVKNVIPTENDPSKMGFNSVSTLIKQQTETNYSDLIKQKLNNI